MYQAYFDQLSTLCRNIRQELIIISYNENVVTLPRSSFPAQEDVPRNSYLNFCNHLSKSACYLIKITQSTSSCICFTPVGDVVNMKKEWISPYQVGLFTFSRVILEHRI